ncbi:flagellar hook-associated protein FlgK [Azospirillum sp. SYSU D00513]|uniref:flagellar hook-associated protein FlgK n=1 Tax=Azospirillum sp. SYSU D00513 TaxID=2812561 RepID=UPI001A976EAE|nr:flagellar hook-associated protein FlgK [Azospirillum sp. SYSU D00513]
MSLFGALGSATAALRTIQANVKVVSDNVARADDPNRTRHTLSQMVDGSGFVRTTEYRREVDSALLAQVQELSARAGTAQTQSEYMQKLGDLMRTTNGKPLLNSYAEEFAAAWKTLEATPENEVAAYQLVEAANNFSREINRVSEGTEDLEREMRDDLGTSLDKVNSLLRDIDQINDGMASLQGQGAAPNEVADKRDGLIRELSAYIDIRTVTRPDGRVAVFTPSGLALADADPAKLTFDGGNINLVVGNQSTPVNQHFQEGKIGALLRMRADGSKSDPPTAPSADPMSEVIRKLRSQLDGLAEAFTSGTKEGQPTSFRDAYDNAEPVAAGEQASGFFVGSDRFTLAVNQKLLNNEVKIKASAIKDVVVAMNSPGRSLAADGLKLEDKTYGGMVSAITGTWMNAASNAKNKADLNTESKQLLEERYHSTTGVNIDEEIAMLQQLQTAYAASARVMQVTNTMFDALERIVG